LTIIPVMSVNEDGLKNTDNTGELRLHVVRAVWGMVHARKKSDEASIVGFRERVNDIGNPMAELVVRNREEGSSRNGHDVTTRQRPVSPCMKRG
jgi:hypothetical protein